MNLYKTFNDVTKIADNVTSQNNHNVFTLKKLVNNYTYQYSISVLHNKSTVLNLLKKLNINNMAYRLQIINY